MPGGRTTPEPDRRARRRPRTHRDTIIATLTADGRFLSAREIHTAIARRRDIPVALTTVYRLLHRLVDEHRATVTYARDGTALYRATDSGAPDRYLLCRRCGRADPFSAPDLELFCDRFAQLHGFTDVRAHIRLHGLCPRCRKPPDPRR